MKPRIEKYFLDNGYGSIDLKGDEFDCAIYFQGKPYAINWSDCEGSVGQYLVRTGIKGYEKDLKQIRYIVENGLDENQLIGDQLYPLLKLFKFGEFTLINYEPEEWDLTDSKLEKQVNYYPLNYVYVPTQSMEQLNMDTLEKYENKINGGEKPIVVTASVEGGWCEFIVDGHHKLEAYRRSKKSPNVLNIQKKKSKLTIEEGASILQGKPLLELYKKVKARYGNA